VNWIDQLYKQLSRKEDHLSWSVRGK